MNRNEEYNLLKESLEDTPIKLDHLMGRLEKRRARNSIYKLVTVPTTTLVMLLTLFTFFVNSSPVFAYACGQIPGLKELTKAVALSPSLLAAVENKYVQSIGERQEGEDMSISVEYLIVDQKQLNVFYMLESDKWEVLEAHPSITYRDGTPLKGYSGVWSDMGEVNELRKYTANFIDIEVPENIQLTFGVEGRMLDDRLEAKPIWDTKEIEEPLDHRGEVLGDFHFDLHFDPKYTAAGEKIVIGETIEMSGQTLSLEEVGIYPSFMEILFDDIPDNTAWLKGLTFYVENERGERFEEVSNGNWTLSFYAPHYKEGAYYQVWSHRYYDEDETEYGINQSSSTDVTSYDEITDEWIDDESIFEETIYLEDYPHKTVYLEPIFTHITVLEEPISIRIK